MCFGFPGELDGLFSFGLEFLECCDSVPVVGLDVGENLRCEQEWSSADGQGDVADDGVSEYYLVLFFAFFPSDECGFDSVVVDPGFFAAEFDEFPAVAVLGLEQGSFVQPFLEGLHGLLFRGVLHKFGGVGFGVSGCCVVRCWVWVFLGNLVLVSSEELCFVGVGA